MSWSSIECSPILSKAFAKSRDIIDVWFRLEIDLAIRWSINSRLSIADFPFLKPV